MTNEVAKGLGMIKKTSRLMLVLLGSNFLYFSSNSAAIILKI